MAKWKITQVRSSIKQPKKQKLTLQALGLRKINQSVELEINESIRGMVRKVHHLLNVEEC